MAARPRVFISYARADGEEFATTLRKRLEAEEPEITLWQDRARMEGGVGWWKQITDAIDSVEFLVMVMTPAAMTSEVARKEWRYARQQGVCVYPVMASDGAELDSSATPLWMRKAHFFDLDKEWDTFVHHLKSPCHAARVPFMAPDLPSGFVARSDLTGQLIEQILDPDRQNPVPGIVALYGAGGLGKTTVAAAVCHQPDVITAFTDGILWVTLGEKPDVRASLIEMYAALKRGERPSFVSTDAAAAELSSVLEDKSCLIVIDDVWNAAHLRAFLQGGRNCVRLITTRHFPIATEFVSERQRVKARQMDVRQAVEMLTARLETRPADLRPFRALARLLNEWPLTLKLARGALAQRMARGDSLEGALKYLNRALNLKGITVFDSEHAEERHQALSKTIDVSLELLSPQEQQRCFELAIFPEDLDVPLAQISQLWDMDEFDTETLIQELDSLSLLEFDLRNGTMRLHGLMRAYFGRKLSDQALVHSRLVDAWGDARSLSAPYAWRWFIYHLMEAGRSAEARRLLLDFDWLHAKLEATDIAVLLTDSSYLQEDTDIGLLQEALTLSAHVLADDKSQLAGQLLGRLLSHDSGAIQALLKSASEWRGAIWFRPLNRMLTAPGGPLLRTLSYHYGSVRALAISDDGRLAVSSSVDDTVTLWDLAAGSELCTLNGHRGAVDRIAISSDGTRAVSASIWSKDLKFWDLEQRAELPVPRAYAGAIPPMDLNGKYLIALLPDNRPRVWNIETDEEIATLPQHELAITRVAVSRDGGRALSCSGDQDKAEFKLWDLRTGSEIRTLEVSPDNRHPFGLAFAGTAPLVINGEFELRVWDIETGQQIHYLPNDKRARGVAVAGDARRAVSFYSSGPMAVWDLETGKLISTLEDSDEVGCAAINTGGQRVISASGGNLRVWNPDQTASGGSEESDRKIRSMAIVGPNVIVARYVRQFALDTAVLVRIQNLETSDEKTFEVSWSVNSQGMFLLAASLDGSRVLYHYADKTCVVRDMRTGETSLLWSREQGFWSGAVAGRGPRALTFQTGSKTLTLWDLDGASEISALDGHDGPVMAVGITPDGRRAISGSEGKRNLIVWDLDEGKALYYLEGHTAAAHRVAIGPNGRRAVSVAYDGTLRAWDLDKGGSLILEKSFRYGIGKVLLAFGGEDDWAVSAIEADRTFKLWDLDRGNTLARFKYDHECHDCSVLSKGAEETTLAVLTADGTVDLLRLER
jgi:WD40 repeat protein